MSSKRTALGLGLALGLMVQSGPSTAQPPAATSDSTALATRTLYLVRHGAYDSEDPRDPAVGKALVPLGVAQSRLAAGRLAALPVTMTSLVSSTFTRARETAYVIHESFPSLSVEATPLLSECTPHTRRVDVMQGLEAGEAESCEAQLERAFATFFQPARGAERHDILVCHGNVIRYLVMRALDVAPDAWLGMSVANCSLTVVRIGTDGAIKVLAVGDIGHVPPNLQTGLDQHDRRLVVPAP